MGSEQQSNVPEGQVLIYRDGATRLQVRVEGRTIWLPQRLIAELYQVSVPTVNEHLASIYGEGELDREATIRNFRIVQREGRRDVSRSIDHYNLDAILAVGYRVRSARGTAFRQWATAQDVETTRPVPGGVGVLLWLPTGTGATVAPRSTGAPVCVLDGTSRAESLTLLAPNVSGNMAPYRDS